MLNKQEVEQFYDIMKDIVNTEIDKRDRQNGSTLKVGTVVSSLDNDIVQVIFPQEQGLIVEVPNPAQIAVYPTNQVYVNMINDDLTSAKIDSRKNSKMTTGWTLDTTESQDPFITLNTTYLVSESDSTPEKAYFRGARTIMYITDGSAQDREIYGVVTDYTYTIVAVGDQWQVSLILRILQQIYAGSNNAIYNITISDTLNSVGFYKKGGEPPQFPLGIDNWRMYHQFNSTVWQLYIQNSWIEIDPIYQIYLPQTLDNINSDPVKWHCFFSGTVEANNPIAASYTGDIAIEIGNIIRVAPVFGTFSRYANLGTIPSGVQYYYTFEKDVLISTHANTILYPLYDSYTMIFRNWIGTDLNARVIAGIYYFQPDVFS